MTGRASICVITSRVVKMLRLITFSCCVLFCVGYEVWGEHEEIKCVQPCPPQKTCRDRFVVVPCVLFTTPCKNVSVCKPGYFRNALKECVTSEECDMCQGENEYFSCGSACDNECGKLDKQNKTNCPIKNIVCNRKCYCEDGFARDDKGNCIPIEKCPSKHVGGGLSKLSEDGARVRRHTELTGTTCTGENEVHTDCKKSCPTNTCLSLVARFKCDSDEPCKNGCICKPGYLRQQPNSPCIPICQCTQMKSSASCSNTLISHLSENTNEKN